MSALKSVETTPSLPDRHMLRSWSEHAVVAGLLVLSLVGLIANVAMPLASFGFPGQRLTETSSFDLLGSELAYEQRLVALPLVGYVLLVVFGIANIVRRRIDARANGHAILLFGFVFFGGLFVALSGARWIGFALARRLEDGPDLTHLGIAPYANVGVGGAALVTCFMMAKSARLLDGTPGRSDGLLAATVGAASLLLVPLFPLARLTGWAGTEFQLEEFTIAVLSAGEPLQRFGSGLALAVLRTGLWLLLLSGTVRFAVGDKPWSAILQPALMVLSALIVWLGAFRFYAALPALRDGATWTPNPALVAVAVFELVLIIEVARMARRRAA